MRLREIRAAPRNHAPIRSELFVRYIRDCLLAAIELHRRQELSIGQLRHVLARAVDAGVRLDVVVPWRQVLVADRPVDGDSILRIRLEVEVAPAVALTSPHQRTPADVVAA